MGLLLWGACGAADAQPDVRTRAKAHYRAGTAFYEAADYDRAIDEFRAGYALLSLPEFLFNLGQAYRLKEDIGTAGDFYRQYLAARPDGADSAEARAHLAEFAAAPARAPAPTSAKPIGEALHRDEPAKETPALKSAAVAAAASTTATHFRSPPPPRPRRRWLWPVLGTAIGVVVGGVGLGLGLGLGRSSSYPSPSGGAVPLQ